MENLRQGLRKVVAKVDISIILSLLALGISGSQLYVENFVQTSTLSVYVTSFSASARDIEDRGGDYYSFLLRTRISLVLTNTGNLSSALLKVAYVVPRQPDADCASLEPPRWDVMSAEGFGGRDWRATAFDIDAQTVPPGQVVIVKGEAHIENAFREKSVRNRNVCLLFIALDHAGQVSVTSVEAANLSVNEQTSGIRYSDQINKFINLLSNRRPKEITE